MIISSATITAHTPVLFSYINGWKFGSHRGEIRLDKQDCGKNSHLTPRCH